MTPEEIAQFAKETLESVNVTSKKVIAELRYQEILACYQGDDSIVSFVDTYNRVVTESPKILLQTGYPSIDEDLYGGFGEGDLVVMGGFSGHGKTGACIDMARRITKQHPVLWFPFEETAEEFAVKFQRWGMRPINFYHPKTTPREDLQWIQKRILEAKIKHGIKVVFIDNLHFITMGEDPERTNHKLGNTTKALKKMASMLNVVIILIVHLRKTPTGVTKMPTLDDIQGSSDIVKVASTVLILWREGERKSDGKIEFTGNTVIGVQKCRRGAKQGNYHFEWERGALKDLGVFTSPKIYEDEY